MFWSNFRPIVYLVGKVNDSLMKNFVLITGVSSGIGFETTRYLLEKGLSVLGSVRSEQDANRLKIKFGSAFHPLIFDVTDPASVKKSAEIAQAIVGSGSLIAIVNNAGVVIDGPLLHIDPGEVRIQLEINVLGVMAVTQCFFPLLRKGANHQVKKRIINIGSVSGLFASPFLGPYCMSKYALEAFTDSLRRECLIYPDIDVVILEPGPFQTPIWQKSIAEENKYPDTDYAPLYKLKKKIVMSREKRAIPTIVLAKEVFKLLHRKRVPARKTVMKRRWIFYLMRNYIPDRLIDRMIMRSLSRSIKT